MPDGRGRHRGSACGGLWGDGGTVGVSGAAGGVMGGSFSGVGTGTSGCAFDGCSGGGGGALSGLPVVIAFSIFSTA